jgi:serine acetyltransferase
MSNAYRYLLSSDHRIARSARKLYWGIRRVSIPAPRLVVVPMLWIFLAVRGVYYFVFRIFVSEPLFKAYCKEYGRGIRTDAHIPWVQGKGDIILGDDVLIDGKCVIAFASRFSEHPTLRIGSHTRIGHGCSFTIGKQITIGTHSHLAVAVRIFDSSGHPIDPARRLAGEAPDPDDVKPVTIGDNVWIGAESIIFPGVRIGDGSVVSTGSVVISDVPSYTLAAGNPARKIVSLKSPTAPDHVSMMS